MEIAELSTVDFEPCDRKAYPPVKSEARFVEMMQPVISVIYAAHVFAYFDKPQAIKAVGGIDVHERGRFIEDLEHVEALLKELTETIGAVILRASVAAANLEVDA